MMTQLGHLPPAPYRRRHDPGMGVMTRRRPDCTLPGSEKVEDGHILDPEPHGGEQRLGRWQEMPVLDGSMIQVQFRRRSAPGARIFLADPPQVLLDGLVTD